MACLLSGGDRDSVKLLSAWGGRWGVLGTRLATVYSKSVST
jgi:hypothetical protein